ncbi:MAG: vWA domain-containing protein, partial [Planctomycetota bacterium]
MKCIKSICVVAASLGISSQLAGQLVEAVPVQVIEEPRTVDLAICLDTSGSMSGLINAARQKLWAIVNELALAEPTPKLRVALLTFGNDGHDPEDGWVRIDSGLTDDLDVISQKLFALTTNGGTEYVGRVLSYTKQLEWHPSDDALKLIVVAGNESADQDQEVPFAGVCKTLITQGIMINSIYCGPATDQIAPGWQEVARLADGQYASIDQDHGTIVLESPFDEQLAELSTAINTTYIPFGAGGQAGEANQAEQDFNARNLNSAAAAARAQTKGQSLYFCSWDLVDACASGQVKIEEVSAEELPENMQTMTADQREAFVADMGRKRGEIKQQIDSLSQQRQAYVAAEMERQALDASNGLDNAIRRAVREQARRKGLSFPQDTAP